MSLKTEKIIAHSVLVSEADATQNYKGTRYTDFRQGSTLLRVKTSEPNSSSSLTRWRYITVHYPRPPPRNPKIWSVFSSLRPECNLIFASARYFFIHFSCLIYRYCF